MLCFSRVRTPEAGVGFTCVAPSRARRYRFTNFVVLFIHFSVYHGARKDFKPRACVREGNLGGVEVIWGVGLFIQLPALDMVVPGRECHWQPLGYANFGRFR